MNRFWVWLSRIGHSRGFGIQSPNDYWFVQYVINERWPYYAYEEIGTDGDWLHRKQSRLYFRLANWRQPQTVVDADQLDCWKKGCRQTVVATHITDTDTLDLVRLKATTPDCDRQIEQVCANANERTLLVVEDIWRNWALWRTVVNDNRTRVCFDLYYCGIVLFDKKRDKKCYIINF